MYVDNEANEDDESEDRLDEMFRDVGEEFTNRSNELDELLNDSKQPLWPGCSKYTRLSAVLKLFNLKAGNGWSDKSFTALLDLINDMLPEDNGLPKSTYDAKKIMCPMGMEYEKIHACPNDCILFRNDYKELNACPICGASQYKIREHVVAYGNLAGYSVKGHKACPICEDNTCYTQLVHGRKTVYLGHRRFLDRAHPYRRLKKAFNGQQDYTDAPQPMTGIEVYERVKGINVTFGKTQKLKSQRGKRSRANVEQLLPVAVRGILPKKLRYTIIRFCFFFNAICGQVIDPDKLDELQNGIIVTLCQLEMYFPPSFFDVMVHLVVHLVREIKQCGPAYLRWMYPFERYMKVLKGYVRNQYRPEASIVESYIAEEVTEFCTEYLAGVEAIGLSKYRHEGRSAGKGTRGRKVAGMPHEDIEEAHLYILHNTSEVEPYLDEYKPLFKEQNPRKTDMWIVSEHNRTFISWFKNKVLNATNYSETVRWLGHGPCMQVICYTGYDINGFSFYTKKQDEKSTMQNSGVSLVANSVHFSSSKDKNPVIAELSYYGVIEEIWEVDYVQFKVPMFRCKWVDSKHDVKADELGFTLVDLNREGHKNEQFIMASQAKQVFFVTDPSDKKWSVVLHGKRQITGEGNEDVSYEIEEIPPFSSSLLPVIIDNEIDGVHASRDDHHEGLWEN
ncbi:PREDICTED: uncharacterized protein LOC109159542 [Ipomoea nil]|uniref:uncharacterized protein LOC109159542 n=1 Tax=Ipomoea nil TaxID=35883 RepID=UPI0009012C18|nr:PREDICTED: uncharacterized protein LOC109159542 [Ipomoea nil]